MPQMAYTHVDKPIRLGGVELKNRIVRPAHATMLGARSMSDDLIAYHEARAQGGAALSIIEVGSVHPSTSFMIDLWNRDKVEAGYRKLVERIKPHGMKIFQQLWHAGHQTPPHDGTPPWSASDIPAPDANTVPIKMTKAMIDEIVAAFAKTAQDCIDYGLDGVEVHCAHAYLPMQFLSPLTNKRDDEYGGSWENRARFALEVVTAVRNVVPSDRAVGVRVAPDLAVGGIDSDEQLKLVQMFEARGLIDFVNVSMGSYYDNPKIIGGMHEPVGYELPTSTPISHHVQSPTIVIGRYATLDDADQVIRSGDADMVGMVRGMIADPDLVNKSLAGKADQVRPCLACNQGCLGDVFTVGRLGCVVNVGAGQELYRGDPHLKPVDDPKKVLVIGGGPAGMEAARVAALRGHKVTLAEATPTLGGTLQAAARTPTRRALLDIATWLEAEIYRLGVEVQLSTFMDENDVIDSGAEAVIVATGSTPRMNGIQVSHLGQPIKGFDKARVLSSTELLMETPADLGRTAVVIDDVGHYEGLGVSEFLIERGLAVTYVTRQREIAPITQIFLMNEPFLRRMTGKPFTWLTRTRAIAIEGNSVIVGPQHLASDDEDTQTLPADIVIFVSGNRPNRAIFTVLSERNSDIRVVGDANSPRYLQAAIHEGHMAGATV
jgi:2,4-dienoyl-CoA reductase-like NADH-dependent reductase (Old Yellow Enzyme family)